METEYGVFFDHSFDRWCADGEGAQAWFDSEIEAWRWLAGNLATAVGLLRARHTT